MIEAAVLLHVRRQQPGGLALVEIRGAQPRDAVQRAAQVGLHERVARLVVLAAAQEDAVRFRKRAQAARGAAHGGRLGVGEGVALGCQLRRRRHQFVPTSSTPNFCQAYSMPRTVPGTPDAR